MQEQVVTGPIIPVEITGSQAGDLESCCALPDIIASSAHILPLYVQLLTLGSIMILGHCSGMCGPLMLSFRFGHNTQGKDAIRAASKQLLTYQLGKAVVYMSAGALAATLGMSLIAAREWLAYICIIVASLILFHALSWWLPWTASFIPRSWYNALQKRIRILQSYSSRARQKHPFGGSFLLGMSMSLLPCMIPFWVLGLATTSASPLHGALLMGLLVVLNTPILLLFAISPQLLGKWKRRPTLHIAPIALCCSAVWMLLIGLATLGYIAHMSFELGPTQVVLW